MNPTPVLQAGAYAAVLLPGAAYEVRYTPDMPVIGFAFDSQSGTHAFGSDRANGFRTRPNSLAYLPAGCDVMSRSPAGGEYLTVRGPCWRGGELPAERRFNDVLHPGAQAAAAGLRRLILSGRNDDLLAVEAAVQALQQAVDETLQGPLPPARGMTPHRLRRIDELIEAEMAGPLTVQRLAGHLGLSAGYFIRAFKAAVGMAPHDYVVDRRLARARGLLRHSAAPLVDIAMACGFSSHAHMSSQFRRRLGVSPSRLR